MKVDKPRATTKQDLRQAIRLAESEGMITNWMARRIRKLLDDSTIAGMACVQADLSDMESGIGLLCACVDSSQETGDGDPEPIRFRMDGTQTTPFDGELVDDELAD